MGGGNLSPGRNMSNGFNDHRGSSMNNGGYNSYDRSMSGNNYESRGSGSGFERQMSVPANLTEHHSMANGYGRQMTNGSDHSSSSSYGVFSSGGGGGNNAGRNNSPPYGGGGMSEMKIGTWNDASTNSASNNSGSGANFPTVSTFEIGTFNISSNNSGGGGGGSGNNYDHGNSFGQRGGQNAPPGGLGIRETGIIEKLLHSYGFIQCCDRQARLFFHFSQFDGNIEHLKIGDPVEFEMTYDRRTGKPIASMVSKIAPEVVMSEERVIGTVTTEARIDPDNGSETQGRISYENRGECFFLPFTMSDVEGNVTVAAGDKVSFQMATMARSGNLVARTIRLENPAAPVKYQGVVNSVKDQKTFGFIERADVVREIFFHFTEVKEDDDIDLGDDVEFTIQTRNGKEVACQIIKLAPGTVIFEDVGTEFFRGQVLKPLDRNVKYSGGGGGAAPTEGDALNGRVKYRAADRSEVEVQFGEKDQVGDFTLRHGDWVQFVIAVDRRDKLKRATKIELLDESFSVSDERREQGTVQSLKDGFGFIKCADRDARMFFHFNECLDVKRTITVADETEFTVDTDPTMPSRQLAIRIKHLPQGTVKFDSVIHKDVTGKVEVEPASNWMTKSPNHKAISNSSTSSDESDLSSTSSSSSPSKESAGKILYELNGLNLEIPLHSSDCDLRNFPRTGDIVKFDINQLKATKETNAVNIRIIESAIPPTPPVSEFGENGKVQQGYIAALKDGFGFIETLSHDKEIFFHFSNVEGKSEKLEVGMEVEYSIFNREKGGKMSAEGVKMITKGTIAPLVGKEDIFNGKVTRPLRSVNPDQEEYCGLIQMKSEEGKVIAEYQFGIASLLNKKELLQVGDPVQFQVNMTEDFAVNIQATREKLRAYVEAMKGQFGFLSHEVDEGKKLFFHTSEVEGNEVLQQGDEVEFVVVTNKRTGKHSACCVRKLSSSKRPERLISKLKTMNLEDAARGGKKIVVVRQPRGPDGSRGFKASRLVEQ